MLATLLHTMMRVSLARIDKGKYRKQHQPGNVGSLDAANAREYVDRRHLPARYGVPAALYVGDAPKLLLEFSAQQGGAGKSAVIDKMNEKRQALRGKQR